MKKKMSKMKREFSKPRSIPAPRNGSTVGADKGTQALNFVAFLLRNAPSSVVSIFFMKSALKSLKKKLSKMKREFSKPRLIPAPRNGLMEWKQAASQFCDQIMEY